MRLYDYFADLHFGPSDMQSGSFMFPSANTVPIDVSAVSDYFLGNQIDKELSDNIRRFRRLAEKVTTFKPPFLSTFLEFGWTYGTRGGVHCLYCTDQDKFRKACNADPVIRKVPEFFESHKNIRSFALFHFYDHNIRSQEFGIIGAVASMYFDDQDRILATPDGEPCTALGKVGNIYLLGTPYEIDVKGVEAITTLWLTIVSVSFHLMNCKNIVLVDTRIPNSIQKKRIKRGERPLFSYKTLTIDQTLTRRPGRTYKPGELKQLRALHLVRGNFATYGEDNKLFGKYTGTFWRPAQMRGSAERGIVVKDYKVEVSQ